MKDVLPELVERRSQCHGLDRAVPLAKDLLAYSDSASALAPAGVNVENRSATFIVSTVAQDREGDIMEPRGCLDTLEDYDRNPVWFYDHSYRKPANVIAFPIGLCKRLGGADRLDLHVSADQIIATCYWHAETQEACDSWRLVQAGILKGASIGFVPIPGYAEKIRADSYHFHKWRLTEISVTGLPSNQECLRIASLTGPMQKSIDRLRSKSWSPGVTIEDPLMAQKKKTKQLGSIAFLKKQFTKAAAIKWLKSHGHESTGGTGTETEWVFPQSKALVEPKDLAKGVKAYVSEEDFDDDEEESAGGDDKGKDGDADKKKPKDGDKEAVIPPGAQTLAELHKHHTGDMTAAQGLKAAAEEMLKYNENADVVAHLRSIIDGHDEECARHTEKLTAIAELAKKAYPDVDFDKLTAAAADDAKNLNEASSAAGGATVDEETAKSKGKALGKGKADTGAGVAPVCKMCAQIKELLNAPPDEPDPTDDERDEEKEPKEEPKEPAAKNAEDLEDGPGAKSLLDSTGALKNLFSFTAPI